VVFRQHLAVMADLAAMFAKTKHAPIFRALIPLLEGALSGFVVETYPGKLPCVRWTLGGVPCVQLKEGDGGVSLDFEPNIIFHRDVEPVWPALAAYQEAMNCLLFKSVLDPWPPELATVLALAEPAMRKRLRLPAAKTPVKKSSKKPAKKRAKRT
jgi:hypothetical protein